MASPGIAVPGSVVAIGSQASPAGAQGIQGPTSVSVNANNKATLGSDSLILVQGTAAGVAATTHAQTVSGDDPQLTNARTPTGHAASHLDNGSDAIAIATTARTGNLRAVSGLTTDFLRGDHAFTDLAAAVQPVIYSVRLRSFNAAGNPNFEVDQASCNAAFGNAPGGARISDRWFLGKNGTMTVTTQTQSGAQNVVPGTSYVISGSQLSIQLTTQQTTLGVNDYLQFQQTVEGPYWRELRGDVHSISLLVYSSVAPLTFAVSLRDSPTITKSFVKTVTLSTANVWTLLTLPNLPVFPSGSFSQNPGAVGYTITIALAAGSGLLTPSPGAWASGNYIGVSGMSNWCANPITSTAFYCAFIQHEPGALCTTLLMDKPFQENLVECQRYYQKSVRYGQTPNQNVGYFLCSSPVAPTLSSVPGAWPFSPEMARDPTVTLYRSDGTANSVTQMNVAFFTVNSVSATSRGIYGITLASSIGAGNYQPIQYNFIADTGW